MVSTKALNTVTTTAKKCGALERDLELLEAEIAARRQDRQIIMASFEAKIVELQRKREALEFAKSEAEADLEAAINVLVAGDANG
jgi:hypothetical protein